MPTKAWGTALALAVALAAPLSATTVARLTFEQLTDASEVVASGHVTRTWVAWDSDHKYIWTHYSLSVADTAKGARVSSVEFAEPGGTLDGLAMVIAGSVQYSVGDSVVLFLSRMPNGYLRTTGWSQGKLTLDGNGRVHGQALGANLGEAEIVGVKAADGASLKTLEGMSFSELKWRVAARVQAGRAK